MATSGVEAQFQSQCDHLAAFRAALLAAIAGRGSLWTMVDDAQDQTYEDRVKGSQITTVDSNLDNVKFAVNIADWFTLHNQYFGQDFGEDDVSNLDTALTFYRWRVHYQLNQLYFEYYGTYLTPANVFGDPDVSIATYARTSSVFTVVNGEMDLTKNDVSKIQAVATSVIGAANLTVTATLVREDDSTVALPVVFTAAATLGTIKVYGEQALSGNAAASQPTVSVAATSQFAIGDKVLVEDDENAETAVIESISTNTSLTFEENLKHAYTTADNAKVTPMYKDVTGASHSLGTNGDTVKFTVAPDREVSLAYTTLYTPV